MTKPKTATSSPPSRTTSLELALAKELSTSAALRNDVDVIASRLERLEARFDSFRKVSEPTSFWERLTKKKAKLGLKYPLLKAPATWTMARIQRASKSNYYSGSIQASERLCFFSHYDSLGIVRPHVFRYLESLKFSGYDIVFITTTAGLRRSDVTRLKGICFTIFRRWNVGMDFGSWQVAFSRLVNLDKIKFLLLTNDSNFGPVTELTPIIRKMERSDADFWGITDSYQIDWHLQSYFLGFKGDVVRSKEFRQFFSGIFSNLDKWGIIDHGEVGLSQMLIKEGYKGKALCPYNEICDDGPFHNPTHTYWMRLIEAGGPFVKIELLRDNPTKVESVKDYRKIIDRTGYPLGLIDSYFANER